MYITSAHSADDNRVSLIVKVIENSQEPFMIHLAGGSFLHLTHKEASLLHTQLMAALYEYEEKQ